MTPPPLGVPWAQLGCLLVDKPPQGHSAEKVCDHRVLEASPLRPTLRSPQPWVPPHARQQRGSKKRAPPTVLDPPEPDGNAPAPDGANGNTENGQGRAEANGGAAKEAGKGGRGKGGNAARGRGRGRVSGKRKAPEAGDCSSVAGWVVL